jgi:hypothetical protein
MEPASAPVDPPRKSEGELEVDDFTDDESEDDEEPIDPKVKALQGFTIKPGVPKPAGPSYFDDPNLPPAKGTSGLFDDSGTTSPAFEANFDEAPAAAPEETREKSKSDDEFATDDENEIGQVKEPESNPDDDGVIPAMADADREQFFDAFVQYTGGSPDGEMSGGQLVQVTQGTGLEQGDLSTIWQLVSAPGASTLTREDFALFMHVLRHRVAGGTLPERVDEDERVRIMGPTHGVRRAPPPPPADHPVVVHIESFANIKDGGKFKNANVSVALVDGTGEPLCPAATTPMGAATPRADGSLIFNAPVSLQATYGMIPRGGAIVLELRHFKEKEKKMSVKCWAYVAGARVERGGSVATASLHKPTDRSGKKQKNFNKGAPDVKVSFR